MTVLLVISLSLSLHVLLPLYSIFNWWDKLFVNAGEEDADSQESYVERKHQFPGMVKFHSLTSSVAV